MQCKMCNNSYCSCKNSCSMCHLTNDVIYFINSVINNWLTPAEAKENKETLKKYYKQIDSFSMMEYLKGLMDEEHFQLALEKFKEKKQHKAAKKNEIIDTSWRVNPNEECVFPQWSDIWGRCLYCNGIKRYMKWKKCWRFQENAGTTVVEN